MLHRFKPRNFSHKTFLSKTSRTFTMIYTFCLLCYSCFHYLCTTDLLAKTPSLRDQNPSFWALKEREGVFTPLFACKTPLPCFCKQTPNPDVANPLRIFFRADVQPEPLENTPEIFFRAGARNFLNFLLWSKWITIGERGRTPSFGDRRRTYC